MTDKKKAKDKKLTIEFKRDSAMNYHWWSLDKKGDTVGGAGGYESMFELLIAPAFLEVVVETFGENTLPDGLLEMAVKRENRLKLPFTDVMVARLNAAFPDAPITDNRKNAATEVAHDSNREMARAFNKSPIFAVSKRSKPKAPGVAPATKRVAAPAANRRKPGAK